MGRLALGPLGRVMAWACAVIIIALNGQLIWQQIGEWEVQTHGAIWIYGLVLPDVIFVGLLLIYVFVRPMLYKHKDDHVYVPHGIASAIDDLEAVKYKHIGVTIDFTKNDIEALRHAIM